MIEHTWFSHPLDLLLLFCCELDKKKNVMVKKSKTRAIDLVISIIWTKKNTTTINKKQKNDNVKR
jgi:hypothetical protein